ncbi:MAG: LuxR C-terminal-related transcriptional regulator, partial [Pseudolabrys sp.]
KISEFTVKVHRSHLMHKMKARTLIDLVRMADTPNVNESKDLHWPASPDRQFVCRQ